VLRSGRRQTGLPRESLYFAPFLPNFLLSKV
jgi:hypothetical protein